MKNRFSKKFIKKKKKSLEEPKAVLTPEEKNREYFQALGSTRASVLMLRVGWAALFVAALNTFISYAILTANVTEGAITYPFYIFLIGIAVFDCFCLLFSFCYRLIFRHQGIFTAVLWIMILFLMLSLVIMGSSLFFNFRGNFRLDDLVNRAYIILILIGITFSLTYNVIWLRKQLKNGFSEERTNANYMAVSSVHSSVSLELIFGLTMMGGIVGQILTKSWAAMFYGVSLNALFIGAFSRLVVEVACLTYLRFKDKIFWQEMPEEVRDETLLKILDMRKTVPRLILEVILFLSFPSILVLFDLELTQNSIWLWLYRLLFFVLLIDGVISYIVYKRK